MEKENEEESRFAKFFVIPHRVIFAIMGFFAIFTSYTMRVSFTLALAHLMVKRPEDTTTGEALCPADDDYYETESGTGGIYEWSEELQGFVLASFYIGYIVTHLPAGVLADKFGGKWVISLGILLSAIFTALSPLAINVGGPYALVGTRIIMGLGQGFLFPAITVLMSHWIPKSERGKLGTLVGGGALIGSIFSNTTSGFLLAKYDWPITFYFFSFISTVWFLIFVLICYSDPKEHPFIKNHEKEYIISEIGNLNRQDLAPIPWKGIFTNIPAISMILIHVGHDWFFYVLVVDMQKYMNDVMRFSITKNGLYSSLPFLLMYIFTMVSGVVADALISHKVMNITGVRKLMTALASFPPAVFMVAASYCGCNRIAVIISFTLCMGFMGTCYSGMRLTPMDLSPNYAGTLMAIGNGLGAFTGILGPYLIGVMTPNATLMEWRMVFWLAFTIVVIPATIFCIWGSGEVQPFDSQKPKGAQE